MKESLKSCAHKLRGPARMRAGDRVLFVERSGELRRAEWLRAGMPGAGGKPSLKGAAFARGRPETG